MQKENRLIEHFHTRVGVYGLILKATDILLITQNEGVYKDLLDLPGGGIEMGETPEQALHREIAEELHSTFNEMVLFTNLSTFHVIPPSPNRTEFYFHRIGLIYKLRGLNPISSSKPFLNELLVSSWHSLKTLNKQQLSPLAWEVISKLT